MFLFLSYLYRTSLSKTWTYYHVLLQFSRNFLLPLWKWRAETFSPFYELPCLWALLFPIRICSTFSRTWLNSANLNLHAIHYVTRNNRIIFRDMSLKFLQILLISLFSVIKTKIFVILSWFTKHIPIHINLNANKLPVLIHKTKKAYFSHRIWPVALTS